LPPASRRLRDLAAAVGGTVEGDPEKLIDGIAPLDQAGSSQITFLANPRYRKKALESRAGAVLAAPEVDLHGLNVVRVEDPYLAMARVLEVFHPPASVEPGIHPEAAVGRGCRIDPSAAIRGGARLGEEVTVGARTVIHPGALLGDRCSVGEDCVLYSNVTLYERTILGNRVILHAGVVLGSDGFGFTAGEEIRVKVPQVGNVVLEDDVEIGANSTVDRATFGSTTIGRGSKIDNLVQIAHNVQIGAGSIMVAQSGIAGSTRLGQGVIFAGQSGAVGHITIGDGARIGAKSAVTSDVPAGAFVIGHPAIEAGVWKRAAAAFARLPEMLKRIRRLERGGTGRDESEKEK
jgi:UDP-3-O-[3-hydroxymyristoyl] glucosamine N-acyltransferase